MIEQQGADGMGAETVVEVRVPEFYRPEDVDIQPLALEWRKTHAPSVSLSTPELRQIH